MESFGETLKRERELREITLREIADATKISIRYLEALEQNRFDILPGGVFNKGFIRAYSTYIGVDGQAMVDRYLHDRLQHERDADAVGPEEISGLHRPAEVPKRRAGPSNELPDGRRLAITFASSQEELSGTAGEDSPSAPRYDDDVPGPHAPRSSSSPTLRRLTLLVAATALIFAAIMLLARFLPGRGAATPPEEPPTPATLTSDETVTDRPARGGAVTDVTVVEESAGGAAHDPRGGPRPQPRGKERQPPADGATQDPSTASPAPEDGSDADLSVASPSTTPDAKGPDAEPTGRPAVDPIDLRVEALAAGWVKVTCDGAEIINRMMHAGETDTARCRDEVVLSAADAAGVRLILNGALCHVPGMPGDRVRRHTIRAANVAEVCPPGNGEGHGGP